MILSVLYQDEWLVAVDKPPGLLVHRSAIDKYETQFAMQITRDQIGRHVYPVHRLDKPTSGILLFALDADTARAMSERFASSQIKKEYLAITRGKFPEEVLVDYPLLEEKDRMTDTRARVDRDPQPARTLFKRLGWHEFPLAVDRFPTSIYSLVRAAPETGRKHQIRRHLRHLGAPVIGDVTYGVGKHNRFFRDHFGVHRLFLASTKMGFTHPVSGTEIEISAPLESEFAQVAKVFDA